MPSNWDRSKRIAIVIGILGIALEAITIFLLSSKRISTRVGTPLVITGMLVAFVPLFLLARRHKR